jgi:hypothetical protein
VNPTAFESYRISNVTLRSLIVAAVFVLGGLHGGPSNAAQWSGHEDDCLECRHQTREASPCRKVLAETTSASPQSHAVSGAALLRIATMVQHGHARASLFGLRCQFLI